MQEEEGIITYKDLKLQYDVRGNNGESATKLCVNLKNITKPI